MQKLFFFLIIFFLIFNKGKAQDLLNDQSSSHTDSVTIQKEDDSENIIKEKEFQAQKYQKEILETLLPTNQPEGDFYIPSTAIMNSQFLFHRLNYMISIALSRKDHILAWDNLIWKGRVSKSDISIIEKIYKYLLRTSDSFAGDIKSSSNLVTRKIAICGYYLLTKNHLNSNYLNISNQEYLDFYDTIEPLTYNQFESLINTPSVDMFLYRKLIFSFENITNESLKTENENLIYVAYPSCESVL